MVWLKGAVATEVRHSTTNYASIRPSRVNYGTGKTAAHVFSYFSKAVLNARTDERMLAPSSLGHHAGFGEGPLHAVEHAQVIMMVSKSDEAVSIVDVIF